MSVAYNSAYHNATQNLTRQFLFKFKPLSAAAASAHLKASVTNGRRPSWAASGMLGSDKKTSFFRSLFTLSAINSEFAFLSTVQIKVSLVIALTLSGQVGGDRLHAVVVGHAGLAADPVLMDRLHDGAHGEEGGRLGDAGIGINVSYN